MLNLNLLYLPWNDMITNFGITQDSVVGDYRWIFQSIEMVKSRLTYFKIHIIAVI